MLPSHQPFMCPYLQIIFPGKSLSKYHSLSFFFRSVYETIFKENILYVVLGRIDMMTYQNICLHCWYYDQTIVNFGIFGWYHITLSPFSVESSSHLMLGQDDNPDAPRIADIDLIVIFFPFVLFFFMQTITEKMSRVLKSLKFFRRTSRNNHATQEIKCKCDFLPQTRERERVRA